MRAASPSQRRWLFAVMLKKETRAGDTKHGWHLKVLFTIIHLPSTLSRLK